MKIEEQNLKNKYFKQTFDIRRAFIKIFGSGITVSLFACSQGAVEMKKEAILNVEMYSYLNRPVHNIIFNGTDLGVMNSFGGTGTITGVRIPFGTQALRWTLGGPKGMAGNGTRVEVKNRLIILAEQMPRGTRYIGLHIYPDYTAEVTFSDTIPERTARGEKIISESE